MYWIYCVLDVLSFKCISKSPLNVLKQLDCNDLIFANSHHKVWNCAFAESGVQVKETEKNFLSLTVEFEI